MKLAEPLLAVLAVITLVVMGRPSVHFFDAPVSVPVASSTPVRSTWSYPQIYPMAGPNELASGSAEDVSGTR